MKGGVSSHHDGNSNNNSSDHLLVETNEEELSFNSFPLRFTPPVNAPTYDPHTVDLIGAGGQGEHEHRATSQGLNLSSNIHLFNDKEKSSSFVGGGCLSWLPGGRNNHQIQRPAEANAILQRPYDTTSTRDHCIQDLENENQSPRRPHPSPPPSPVPSSHFYPAPLPGQISNSRSAIDTKTTPQQMLVDDWNSLTAKQREDISDQVHGIQSAGEASKCLDNDEQLMASHLEELSSEIDKIRKNRHAYDRAMFLSPSYVQDKDFRLMFLRSTDFDSRAAANRLVQFFAFKLSLFGIGKLVQDIALDDLRNPQEQQILQDGNCTLLPVSDRAGRTICLITKKSTSPVNQVCMLYNIMYEYVLHTQLHKCILWFRLAIE